MKLNTILQILCFLLLVGLYIQSPKEWKDWVLNNTPTVNAAPFNH